MKKTLALVLAALMTAGMTTVAFAAKADAVPVLGYKDNATGAVVAVKTESGAYELTTAFDSNFESGEKVYIPISMWADDAAQTGKGSIDSTDDVTLVTDKDDIKGYKIYTDWKVGDVDVKPYIDYVKFDGKYAYAVVVEIPETVGAKTIDLAGTITIAKTSTAAKDKTTPATFDFDTAYSASGEAKVELPTEALPSGGALVKFEDECGEIDIEFGEEALFTVDANGQGDLNLMYNTDFLSEVAALDESANMDFLTFEGNPSFNKNGTLYIYADDDTGFLYQVVDGELKAIDAEYDEDYEAWFFKTRTLGTYVLSDKEIENLVITDGDEDASSSTTEDGGKKNPDTGR